MKYKDWLKEWLRLYVKPYVKERTYIKYDKQIALHVLPFLGDYDMEDLYAVVLQDWSVKLQESGLSPNTVNSVISRLKDSLKKAVISGIITKEFSGNIIRPKSREKQVDCFSKTEQKKIEQHILIKQKPKLYGFLLCLFEKNIPPNGKGLLFAVPFHLVGERVSELSFVRQMTGKNDGQGLGSAEARTSVLPPRVIILAAQSLSIW